MTSTPKHVRTAAYVLRKAGEDPPSTEGRRAETVSAIREALRARSARRVRGRYLVPATAAAALVLVGVGWRMTRHRDGGAETAAVAGAIGVGLGTPDRGATSVLHVERVLGGVSVEDAHGTMPLRAGAAVPFGQRISGSEGSATLSFSSGTRLDLDRASDVVVHEDGGVQLVRFDRGSITASVAKVAPGARFLVQTGDVEVEVRGTVFHVERIAQAACETKAIVTVREGRVVVRSRGEERMLSAGERWSSPCEAPAPPVLPLPQAPPSASSPAKPRATAQPDVARPAGTSEPPSSSDLAAQNALFASAMTAKKRGDAGEAVARLDELLARHPHTPLHEAASAERVRLLEGRDPARASQAARDYLRQYPGGFARQDAERALRNAPAR